jgi:hypothetical protein
MARAVTLKQGPLLEVFISTTPIRVNPLGSIHFSAAGSKWIITDITINRRGYLWFKYLIATDHPKKIDKPFVDSKKLRRAGSEGTRRAATDGDAQGGFRGDAQGGFMGCARHREASPEASPANGSGRTSGI